MSKMALWIYPNQNKNGLHFVFPQDEGEDITVSFYRVLKTMQLLGNCPLTIKPIRCPSNPHKVLKYEYSYKFLSFPVIYAIIAFLLYSVFLWYIILFQVVTGKITQHLHVKPASLESSATLATSAFMFIYYVWLWIDPFLLIIRASYVDQFLNGIAVFCHQFTVAFNGKRANFSVARASIRLVFFVNFAFILILVMGLIYIYAPCLLSNFYHFEVVCMADARITTWTSVIAVILGVVINFSQDTMFFTLLRLLENMLLQVKTEIECRSRSSHGQVNVKNIRDWVKIGRIVKRQADAVNLILGPEGMASLFTNFLTWVLFAFMLANISSYEYTVLGPVTFFCVVSLLRLHFKTISVTRITTVEKEIRNLLVKMEVENYSSYIECERSFLVNVMACRPIRFTFGNLITLDSSLTIWLIGGVATYLMVLLQFQDLMNAEKKKIG